MHSAYFSFISDNVILFPVKEVHGSERVAYIDAAMHDYEEVWRTMHASRRRFAIIMDISEMRTSHPKAREHMIRRLQAANDGHPGTWAAVAIVASSVLTRGIATVYLWAADTFPHVGIKVFGDREPALAWAQQLANAPHPTP